MRAARIGNTIHLVANSYLGLTHCGRDIKHTYGITEVTHKYFENPWRCKACIRALAPKKRVQLFVKHVEELADECEINTCLLAEP